MAGTRRSRGASEGHHEGFLEHAREAVADEVRTLELGLLQGDHTPIGEISGLIEEVAHPEGETPPPAPRRRRRRS